MCVCIILGDTVFPYFPLFPLRQRRRVCHNQNSGGHIQIRLNANNNKLIILFAFFQIKTSWEFQENINQMKMALFCFCFSFSFCQLSAHFWRFYDSNGEKEKSRKKSPESKFRCRVTSGMKQDILNNCISTSLAKSAK